MSRVSNEIFGFLIGFVLPLFIGIVLPLLGLAASVWVVVKVLNAMGVL